MITAKLLIEVDWELIIGRYRWWWALTAGLPNLTHDVEEWWVIPN